MRASDQPTTYAERLAAMNLLRENLFYANPGKYSITDVAEDLPGSARSFAPAVKNVLPSAAIISSNPEERKQQIMDALRRIKRSGAKSELGKEVLNNAISMGGGALAAGFALSLGSRFLGWRGLKGVDSLGKKVFQNPFELSKNIARLSSKKNYANALLRRAGHDALTGAALGATTGAAYPIIEHHFPTRDKALIEAANILQKQPYITSLPGGEAVSALRESDPQESKISQKLKNTAAGTAIGSLLGASASILPAALIAGGRGASNVIRALKGKPARTVIPRFLNELRHEIPGATLFGGAAGGLAGALTDRLPSDER